jgi:hypothetical protein
MPTFGESLASSARSALCTYLSAGSGITEYFQGARVRYGPVTLPGSSLGVNLPGMAAGLFCPNDVPPGGFPPGEPSLGGPGPGGNGLCPVIYEFGVGFRDASLIGGPSNVERTSGQIIGPVGEFYTYSDGTGIGLRHGDGLSRDISGTGTVEDSQPFFTRLNRFDGGPENCGDQPGGPVSPPVVPPTPGPTTTEPITYDDTNGDPITEPVTRTPQPPVILPDGSIRICVLLETSRGSMQVCFDTAGGDPIFTPPGFDGSECCEPPDVPPEEVPPSDEPEDEEDPQKRITSVIVTTSTAPDEVGETRVFGEGGGPDLYLPDLGVVTFGVKVGIVTVWTTPIKVQLRRQVVQCPDPRGAISVRGIPRASVDWQLTEIVTQVPSG